MNTEKKNTYPWETLDTTTLMLPEEIIAYHLYKLKEEERRKRDRGVRENRVIISSYLKRIAKEKEENQTCFQKL